jgi:hypothetical protein
MPATQAPPPWKLPADYWKTADVEFLKLMLQLAQERVDEGDQISRRVTERAFTLLSILIPLVSLLIALMAGIVPSGDTGFVAGLKPSAYLVFIPVLACLVLLAIIITPRNYYSLGFSPSESFQAIDASVAADKTMHQRKMLNDVLEHLEVNIQHYDDINARRVGYLKIVYWTLVGWLALVLALLGYNEWHDPYIKTAASTGMVWASWVG